MNAQKSPQSTAKASSGARHDAERRDRDRREHDRREADHKALQKLEVEIEQLDRQLHRERSFVKPFYGE